MFHLNKPFSNKRGSTLTATLVALGISGIIISTILSAMTMGWGQIAQQEGRANRALLIEDIKSELSNADRCKLALAVPTGKISAAAGGAPLSMKFSNGVEVRAGAVLQEYGQEVKSFKFLPFSTKSISATQNSVFGDVVITTDMSKNKTFNYGQKSIGKLSMITSKANDIQECSMTGLNTAEEICQALGGVWNGNDCKLPTTLLAMEEVCKGLGGTWASNNCKMPGLVASTPTTPTTPTTPSTPKPSPTPDCFERNENVTWCVQKCATKPAATAGGNPREVWTLINQVSSEKVAKPNCPNVGYRSTCRYKVTCKK